MLVDSHCHLDARTFQNEIGDILGRAKEAGVGAMMTICTRPRLARASLALAESHENIFCAIGLHPHYVEEEGVPEEDDLVALADHPKVVAFGETGLDYHYDRSPRELQEESFRRHIRAARRAGVPFVVHTRNADADTARILESEAGEDGLSGIMHCFSSGRKLAEKSIELGMHVSISGIATFPKSEDLRGIVRDIPLERLLVETDAPFLAPVPLRGKRNEPSYVVHTAAVVAELKGLDPESFAGASTENFFRLIPKARACA